MRVACVFAPQIALQAVLRRDPDLRDEAVVLVDGKGERARVVALTRAAHRTGVRRALTVSQARAVAAGGLRPGHELRVFVVSEADTAAARAALMDVALAFAPRAELESERVFLEVGDLGRLYPDERAIAQAIVAQAARLGLAVRVVVASGKGAARVKTEADDVAVVPPGQERAALGDASVRAALRAQQAAPGFPGADDMQRLVADLERWGVRTLGALARLPRDQVVLRLGASAGRVHRLASGHDDEPFAPQPPPDALEEGTELDYSVCELEPLAFVLRGLLDRALARLDGRGLGCARLTLRLKLEPRGYEVREIPMAAPTRAAPTLLSLARLELARRPPSASVVGVAALVLPARLRPAQLDFLRPAGPAPERLAATLARLAALVGIDNVGAPAVVDSHREEAIGVVPFEAGGGTPAPARDAPALAFRRFRPPQALEVLMGRHGPVALQGAETTARVLTAAGPYRVSGEWWASEGFSRDYWDVHASDGAVYRVHQDRTDGRWYLDGYYD